MVGKAARADRNVEGEEVDRGGYCEYGALFAVSTIQVASTCMWAFFPLVYANSDHPHGQLHCIQTMDTVTSCDMCATLDIN